MSDNINIELKNKTIIYDYNINSYDVSIIFKNNTFHKANCDFSPSHSTYDREQWQILAYVNHLISELEIEKNKKE